MNSYRTVPGYGARSNIRRWLAPCALIWLVVMLTPFAAPRRTSAEPAWWTQMKQTCISSGGQAASDYNTWQTQGCICNGSPSRQLTCSGGSSSSNAGSGSSGDLVTDSTKNVVKGIMNGNSQQTGYGLMGLGVGALIKGMQDDPVADARRAREAARAAELQRQAEEQQRREEEQRRAEMLRQQELSRQRLLGSLKGARPSTGLALKRIGSDTDLQLKTLEQPIASSASGQRKSNGRDTNDPRPLRSDAYSRGFADASQCYSQNAVPYCTGVPRDQGELCLSDYRAGYTGGDEQRKQLMADAFQAGRRAGEIGGPANGASDPRAEGACRVQWIETYNRGHFEGEHAK
jgi:hypothetical protein